ncbi:hypothetical protein K402DRAFT_424923 [Aulographum hederae CBS 113979]|uniref:Uncharacterized protein n=1 Tax=Aulographum hederae CBS 113979 TaxID=1176131 RepID=A0A6G1GM99_9PEZI|nr:hypothetical protein K402DRAFT_424923 [Aulographum hederae CBS 113979]
MAEESSTRISFNLDKITPLESSDNYLKWLEEMQAFFVFSSLNDVFTRPSPPVRTDATTPALLRTFNQDLASWKRKQELASAAIRNRVCYNAKLPFAPRGMGRLNELTDRYESLSLGFYNNVSEYNEAFNRAVNKLQTIGIHPDKAMVTQRYLRGLGSRFSVSRNCVFRDRILFAQHPGEIVITLGRVQRKAFGEEKSFDFEGEKYIGTQHTASNSFLATNNKADDETTIIKVPYCTHCKRNYHTATQCHKKHPDLKRLHEAKRGRHDGSNTKRKRRSDHKTP